jgi:hypothetical protein
MACIEWLDGWPRPIPEYASCLQTIYRTQLELQVNKNFCDLDSDNPLRITRCRDYLNSLITPAFLATPGFTEFVSRSCQYPGSEIYGPVCDRFEKEYQGRAPEFWPILAEEEFGVFGEIYKITRQGGPVSYCPGQNKEDIWKAAQKNFICAISFDPKPCQQSGCNVGEVCGEKGTCFVTAPIIPPISEEYGYTTQQLTAWILQWVFGLVLIAALLVLGRSWQNQKPMLDQAMIITTILGALGFIACIAIYYW